MKGLCYRDLSLLLVRDKELSDDRRQQCGSQLCSGRANLTTNHQQ